MIKKKHQNAQAPIRLTLVQFTINLPSILANFMTETEPHAAITNQPEKSSEKG